MLPRRSLPSRGFTKTKPWRKFNEDDIAFALHIPALQQLRKDARISSHRVFDENKKQQKNMHRYTQLSLFAIADFFSFKLKREGKKNCSLCAFVSVWFAHIVLVRLTKARLDTLLRTDSKHHSLNSKTERRLTTVETRRRYYQWLTRKSSVVIRDGISELVLGVD